MFQSRFLIPSHQDSCFWVWTLSQRPVCFHMTLRPDHSVTTHISKCSQWHLAPHGLNICATTLIVELDVISHIKTQSIIKTVETGECWITAESSTYRGQLYVWLMRLTTVLLSSLALGPARFHIWEILVLFTHTQQFPTVDPVDL